MPPLRSLCQWLAIPLPALLVLIATTVSDPPVAAPPSPSTSVTPRSVLEPSGAASALGAPSSRARAVLSPRAASAVEPREPRLPASMTGDAADTGGSTAGPTPVPERGLARGAADGDAARVPPARPLIVSFYGVPGVPQMGALGSGHPAAVAERLDRVAREFEPYTPAGVIPAFHLIVAVAQAHATEDGTYLARLSDEAIREYVETARERHMLVFLDIQVGWSSALAEVAQLETFLREPFVHVALDPEFATREKDTAPGHSIGFLDAADLNAVQHYLADLSAEHGLPPKMLVVHQFLERMIARPQDIAAVPTVELVIDMDGFGSPALKTAKYESHALASHAEFPAIKLFYDWDAPLMSPADVMALREPPVLVIYQ